jgi:hypothetical protein
MHIINTILFYSAWYLIVSGICGLIYCALMWHTPYDE